MFFPQYSFNNERNKITKQIIKNCKLLYWETIKTFFVKIDLLTKHKGNTTFTTPQKKENNNSKQKIKDKEQRNKE